MSGLVVGMIKRRAIAQPCKMILVCMADHGNDQGENIHRSMQKLSREACCHKRTVQKKIGHMVKIGVLVDVGQVTYGRGRLRGFRIDLDAVMALFPDCHAVDDDIDPSDLAGLIEEAESAQEAGSGAAAEDVPEDEKGGPRPPFGETEKGGPEDQKGGPESTKGWPQRPPEPLRTIKEPPGARGGDPDGPPREPGDEPKGSDGDGDAPSPETERVNRHWKPAREHFVKRRSEGEALAWWDDLIPLRHDDDGTLVLDVPSQFTLDQIQARYSRAMEWALREAVAQSPQDGANGQLRFVIEGLAARAKASRKARAEEARSAATGTKRSEKQQSKPSARARR